MKTGLFELIDKSLSGKEGWCTLEKAHTLAALVIVEHPRVIVEIGVWTGSSLLPMALAAKALGEWVDPISRRPIRAHVHAIDAWNPEISATDQIPINAEWWLHAPHDWAEQTFRDRLRQFEVEDVVSVHKCSSQKFNSNGIFTGIDLLHIDGNHGPQAEHDVMNYASMVKHHGVLILDDVHWSGGHVQRAADEALKLGFRPRYELETGLVFRRVS